MTVALLNDLSTEDFSKELLTIISLEFLQFCFKVFPNFTHKNKSHKWLSERAILAAKNKDVDALNFVIQNPIDGTLHSFKSFD
jgi:PIF1 helicase.